MDIKVPVIVGPTAVGKTALSLHLASKTNCQIISADSRQIYKYMDIGTAKVTVAEREKIPHHFIDILEPDVYFSAGKYATAARSKIESLLHDGIIPVVVGGSGLYIRALTDGIVEFNAKDETLRKELLQRIEKYGLVSLYEQLKQVDANYAAKISGNDQQRILRALEVFLVTGRNFSDWHTQEPEPAPFNLQFYGLNSPRQILYERINQRVEFMIKSGLVEEVSKIVKMGFDRELNSLNTVGYKEVLAYLNDEIKYIEMVELIKRKSRRYAKRQLTWFNSDKRIQWFNVESEQDLAPIANLIFKNLI